MNDSSDDPEKLMNSILMTGLIVAASIGGQRAIYGQAFCALRDPVRQVRVMFPAANYRSVVRTVSPAARQYVSEHLPFTIHFNELGQHTLYVVSDGTQRRGYVHVRPERIRGGIMEIVWALDNNLKIVDFQFQRCRHRSRASFASAEFRTQFRGLGFNELRNMLSVDGKTLSSDATLNSIPDLELTAALIRCALKTIVLTKASWPDQVEKGLALYRAQTDFPDTTSVLIRQSLYNEAVLQTLSQRQLRATNMLERDSVTAILANNVTGSNLGVIAGGRLLIDTSKIRIWWSIDSSGKIASIVPDSGHWPDRQMSEAFEAVIGKSLENFDQCKTAAELASLEILVVHSFIRY